MGKSKAPSCKFKVKVKFKGEDYWLTHSYYGKYPVVRNYAKIPTMKALPHWFCTRCGNMLNDDGTTIHPEPKVQTEVLKIVGLTPDLVLKSMNDSWTQYSYEHYLKHITTDVVN